MSSELLETLVIALGLGLLVGLQRERSDARIAGIRTFTLITLLGAICGLLAQTFGGWAVAAGFVALAAVLVGANLAALQRPEEDVGQTTTVAALVMYALGAYVAVGDHAAAIAVGGIT